MYKYHQIYILYNHQRRSSNFYENDSLAASFEKMLNVEDILHISLKVMPLSYVYITNLPKVKKFECSVLV